MMVRASSTILQAPSTITSFVGELILASRFLRYKHDSQSHTSSKASKDFEKLIFFIVPKVAGESFHCNHRSTVIIGGGTRGDHERAESRDSPMPPKPYEGGQRVHDPPLYKSFNKTSCRGKR
jgi:hypothetical protein